MELIREDDTLNQGRKKLNNAIKAFNETVVNGDSSVEAAQARVDEKGEVHPTLKARIDRGFTKVTSQLAQTGVKLETKVDKNGSMQVNYANLSQDVREKFTGGNVAVVGVESTGQINLTPNAVTVHEAEFLEKGKNLIIEEDLIHGYIIDRSTGGFTPANGFSATKNWIRIIPGETIHKNVIGNYVWGDASKNPFGGGNASSPAGPLEVPENAYFIKLSMPTKDVPNAQLEYGDVETPYEKGEYRMQRGIKYNGAEIEDDTIPIEKLTGFVQSKNLLNPRRIIPNHYVRSSDGELIANDHNDTFKDILLPKGVTTLRVHNFTEGVTVYCFRTRTGLYLSGKSIQPEDDKVIEVPAGAKTIDISFAKSEISRAMLSAGSEEQPYEEYYKYLVDIVSPSELGEGAGSVSRLSGKTGVAMGDSLTGMYADHQAYPKLVEDKLGLKNYYNVGFSGTRMSDTSVAQYKAFSLPNLVDSIISGDYSLQDEWVSEGSSMYAPHLETLKGIDWNTVDFVSIYYGANDYSGHVPLDNDSDPFDKTTYMGACRYAIKHLTEAFPHLKFVLISPSYRYDADGVANNAGLLMEDYVEATYMVHQDLKIPMIDIFYNGQINRFNYSTYLQPDGLHYLASTGLPRISDVIANGLETFL